MSTEELAYYLWEQAGCPNGRDQEFWLQAEKMQQDRLIRQQEDAAERKQDIAEQTEKIRQQREAEAKRSRELQQEKEDFARRAQDDMFMFATFTS